MLKITAIGNITSDFALRAQENEELPYDALRIHVNKKPNKTLDTDNADFDI